MWRNLLGRASLRKIKFLSDSSSGTHFPVNRVRGILSSVNLSGVRNGLSINPISELGRLSSFRHGQCYAFEGYATAAQLAAKAETRRRRGRLGNRVLASQSAIQRRFGSNERVRRFIEECWKAEKWL